ncbi:MAG: NAD(P)-binding domain-containing protein [Planctomycetales bacterium]|nr:NAD(P)-binding domain-containing protein [Planctomycetales bacterium]
MPVRRIAIIGAGPIGLEAALCAAQAGFDVRVFDRGSIAQNVRDWGHVRLFSPFEMNSSERGREAVRRGPHRAAMPTEGDYVTGREFVERYLFPLSRTPELAGRIHEQAEVFAISRSRHLKGDLIGDPARGHDPFQMLVRTAQGSDEAVQADVVLDCSGTYPHHNWLGAGGIPCVGELACTSRIDYGLPDIIKAERPRFTGKTTLVVGGGYSAASAIVELAAVAAANPATHILWVTRSDQSPPLSRFENDPLTERDRLAARANDLVIAGQQAIKHGHPESCPVKFLPGRVVCAIEYQPQLNKFLVVLDAVAAPLSGAAPRVAQTTEQLIVDNMIANVGYRPDRSLYEELQVHECYATQGPIRLAAALLGERTSADCLSQSSHGASALTNPEPGFFILGAKSYGRDSRFLMRVGLEQVRDVFALLRPETG